MQESVRERDRGESSAAATRVPPAPNPQLIDRARLDSLFEEGRGRVVRVLAPAGYGKTSLAARWVSSDERLTRWIDIDRGDNDPLTLFNRLQASLSGIVEVPAPTSIPAPSTNPYVVAIRAAFARAEPQPFVLVLDDVHRLRTTSTGSILEVLIEQLPPTSTLVLVGRAHHDHRTIGRSRLQPGVVDVTVDDLAFDASETHQFLTAAAIDPATPGLPRTLETLLGWPAGLRLAADAVRRGAGPPHAVDHATLVDYLRDNWIASLEPDALSFLRDVACLDDFSGAKCDTVLGRTGSAEMLHRLCRDEMVVFGLDQRAEWYRLHPLLSRWLSADLRSSEPERWVEVHTNAARYWEAVGDIDRAVGHASAIDDFETLERLVVTHGGPYLTRGFHATVGRWLHRIPADRIRDSPGLCGVRCVHAMHLGDESSVVQWKRLLDDAVAARGRPTSEPTTWWPTVIAGTIDVRPARELIPAVAQARSHLRRGPWAAYACWIHGSLCLIDGALDDARDAFAAGVFEGELNDNPLLQSNCLAADAILDECEGDGQLALDKRKRAVQILRSGGSETPPTAALGVATTALLDASEGRWDDAAGRLAMAQQSLRSYRSIAPWFNVLARIPLVRTALLIDDRDLGHTLLQELDQHARLERADRAGSSSPLLAYTSELRRRVEAMHRRATGASALTDAELRVLRLLPTNLSLADIAERLFVSRNTVKSHAASIYRKLGADNRGRAVELAIEAGLFQTDELSGR